MRVQSVRYENVFGILVIGVGVYFGAVWSDLLRQLRVSDSIKTEATMQTYTTKPESEIQTPS